MIKMSGTVGSILKHKGSEVWFVTPDQTVYEPRSPELPWEKQLGYFVLRAQIIDWHWCARAKAKNPG